MSASREKKQRQGAGLSEKALQAQQQQAERKRKTVIYTAIGAVVAVLIVALLSWNAWNNNLGFFAFFKGRATAATVGGRNLSAAELSYYYYSVRNNEFYYYSYFGITPPSDSDVRDTATGQTYREYFLETALSSAQENFALADMARESGHTDAEVRDNLNARIKNLKDEAAYYGYSYSSYLKATYGPYMSAGVYEKLYTVNLLANVAYNEKANELLDGYTEADLSAYYNEDDHADALDTFEYSYLYFTPAAVEEKDEDGNARDEEDVKADKEAALAKAKEKAEAAMEALRNGESVSSLVEQYELADNTYKDHESDVGISSTPSLFHDDLLAMEDGDVELVENGESGYYVVTLHSRRLVEDPTKDVRHILVKAENTVDEDGKLVAPTDAAWAAAKAKIEAIQAEYEAGNKTEDSFAALANEKSDDGDGTTGGLYTDIGPDDNYVPEFLEWIYTDGRKVGDTGIVQHDAGDKVTNGYWGYHFMYFVGDGDNKPVWMRAVRNALASRDLDAWLDGLLDDYPAALTGGAGRVGG